MLQDSVVVKQRHERFLRKVSETNVVWGLESDEGFATSSSTNFKNDRGESTSIICFWSEAALAKSCIREGWLGYAPVAIPLNDFIENWCIGMSKDGFLVGTNFDQNMFGFESDPHDLVLELSQELKKQAKEILLNNYDHLDQLVNEILKLRE
jgi:hypothetical protein